MVSVTQITSGRQLFTHRLDKSVLKKIKWKTTANFLQVMTEALKKVKHPDS